MIAAHIENGPVSIKRLRTPVPPENFALIRLIAGGICNTDLELQRGYYSFKGIPGHEFVGEVVQADEPVWVGKRVVGEINLACRKCDWCKRGLGRHCPKRSVLGIVKHPGAFREFLTLPIANLHEIPPRIANEEAVFIEPLAAACEILEQVDIPAGAEVGVLGDGKLGLLIAQALHARGLQVHHYGRHRDKLRIAERAGVATVLVGKSLPTHAYDYVVDATGSVDGLHQAVGMTRPRGTVIMKSTIHGRAAVDTASIIVNEMTLVGSRCGRFEPALALLRAGKINVADMVSDQFELKDAPKAFRKAAQRGVLKVLLRN